MARPRARSWALPALLAVLGPLVLPSPAHVYIDPGAGSMLYQAVLAALLGLAFTFRTARDWIARTVRGLFGATSKAEPDGSSSKRSSSDRPV